MGHQGIEDIYDHPTSLSPKDRHELIPQPTKWKRFLVETPQKVFFVLESEHLIKACFIKEILVVFLKEHDV